MKKHTPTVERSETKWRQKRDFSVKKRGKMTMKKMRENSTRLKRKVIYNDVKCDVPLLIIIFECAMSTLNDALKHKAPKNTIYYKKLWELIEKSMERERG